MSIQRIENYADKILHMPTGTCKVRGWSCRKFVIRVPESSYTWDDHHTIDNFVKSLPDAHMFVFYGFEPV